MVTEFDEVTDVVREFEEVAEFVLVTVGATELDGELVEDKHLEGEDVPELQFDGVNDCFGDTETVELDDADTVLRALVGETETDGSSDDDTEPEMLVEWLAKLVLETDAVPVDERVMLSVEHVELEADALPESDDVTLVE